MLTPRGVRRVAFFIYLVAIALMIALPFLGHNAKGATRWVEIAGFTLQPSEFMKPALIVLVAWMFAEGQKGEGVPGVSIAFCLYLPAVALLLIEPDVGQTVLITIAFGAAFWMAGVPMSWVMVLGGVGGRGPRQHLFRSSTTWPAASTASFSHDKTPDTHQVAPRRRGHRRRRPLRPGARRGDHEAPGARHAHRLRLFGVGRGVRPVALADPDRALHAS